MCAAPETPLSRQLGRGGPDAETIADRLVARLAQSGAMACLGDNPERGGRGPGAAPGWGECVASLEARLAALLDERLQRMPLQPVQGSTSNARQQQGQQGPTKAGIGHAGSAAAVTAASVQPAAPAADMQRLQVLLLVSHVHPWSWT